jgi:hypothetical protein
MYFLVNGAKYWALLTPSGAVWYRKEGSKTKYLGRLSATEIKEMLAKAGAEALQRIKSDVESVLQVLNRQKTAASAPQLSQPSSQQPTLTWKRDGHTYWLLHYNQAFYVYMKGPSTKHKPRLIEKSDINGVIGRLVAAGALHVLEALRLVVNGLHAAVADLLKPPAKPQTPTEESKNPQTPPSKPQAPAEARREAPQVLRREAEAALKELKLWLRREIQAWREKYSRRVEKEGLYEVDPDWVREDFARFVREYQNLLEKIQPHPDLFNKFVDAAVEATYGYLSRSDVLEILK